jgi:hypothetical protein
MSNPYLRFEERSSPGRKTKQVDIFSVSNGDQLGLITWHGPWRQYCFWPADNTLWNKGCLETVNEKIESLMAERRVARKG